MMASKEDVDNIGEKVGNIQMECMAHRVRTDRNTTDIELNRTETWEAISEMRRGMQSLFVKFGIISGIGFALTFLISVAGIIIQLTK